MERRRPFLSWNIRVLAVMLGAAGSYSLSTCFNSTSRLLKAVSGFWCVCRVVLDISVVIINSWSVFTHQDRNFVYLFENLLFNVYCLFNTCYCVVLSLHPDGFIKMAKNLERTCTQGVERTWSHVVLAVVVHVLHYIPCVTIVTHIAFSMQYDAYVDNVWAVIEQRSTTAFRVFIFVVVFQMIPVALFTFHFMFILLVISIFVKFHTFHMSVVDQVNLSHQHPLKHEALQSFEDQFSKLSTLLEHFNEKFSVFLGVNISVWMVMVCAVLYVIAVKASTGYDLVVVLYGLQLLVALYCCSLLNHEVSVHQNKYARTPV